MSKPKTTYKDLDPLYERAFYKREGIDLGKVMATTLKFIEENQPVSGAAISAGISGPSMTACLCLMKEGKVEWKNGGWNKIE